MLYKYNDDSKTKLLADNHMAALFHNFCVNGRDALWQTAIKKSWEHADALMSQLNTLDRETFFH